MAEKPEDIAERILRDFEQEESDRGTLDSHCEEIAARIWPAYKGVFHARGDLQTQGDKRTHEMYDATAALALTKFGAVMESILTPRASKWQRVVPVDKALARNRQVREWFEDATDRLFAYRNAPKANYASQKQEEYLQLGAFGTGPMYIDKLDGGVGLRYRSCALADTYLRFNHQGQLDTVLRRIMYTARQAVQKWGKERMPEAILKALEKDPKREFLFVHCVMPREDVDRRRVDFKGMPFASYYVSKEGRKIISEGGYHTMPYSAGRHAVAPGEKYGRSPAMLALPNIKTLNEQKKTLLKQGHRAVDPVLLAHDDGVLDSFSLKSGAINYGGVSADGKALVHALPVGRVDFAKDMMADERMVIKDAFYITLFEILVEDRREMTATEVLERAREKGILLAPAMGRQQTESLGPQTEREIDLLAQQGLLRPMPRVLAEAQAEWQAEYDSPLSRMMRAEEAGGFVRWVEMALKAAAETQNPEPLDFVNWDVAMPELAEINAVPVRWTRSMEDVQARREGRSQQAATAQLVDALPGIAGVAKAVGDRVAR